MATSLQVISRQNGYGCAICRSVIRTLRDADGGTVTDRLTFTDADGDTVLKNSV